MRRDIAAEARHALTDPYALLAALGARGVRRSGAGAVACCVAHDDRSPSMSVTLGPDGTLRARCFSCGFATDALGLVAASQGLDARSQFAEVLSFACGIAGIDGPPSRVPSSRPSTFVAQRPLQHPRNDDATTVAQPLDESALAPCLASLDEPSAADVASYLDQRGLLCAAIAAGVRALDLAELRYAVEERLGMGGHPVTFERAGLIRRRDDGWSTVWPSHRLVIPWRSSTGKLLTIQRRIVVDASPRLPKYVFPTGGGADEPFGAEWADDGTADLVLCEGAVDAIARRQLGSGVVFGVAGVGWALRFDWSTLVAGRVVRIAFDADAAGDEAAEQLAPILFDAGASRVLRERPLGAKDWAALLERNEVAA